jgi:hypothetical protein
MEFTDQNGKKWTGSEMAAAFLLHTLIFMAKSILFCMIFNKMTGGAV